MCISYLALMAIYHYMVLVKIRYFKLKNDVFFIVEYSHVAFGSTNEFRSDCCLKSANLLLESFKS
jgi:hypothetical protein